jgi:hypothetical protein
MKGKMDREGSKKDIHERERLWLELFGDERGKETSLMTKEGRKIKED